MAQVYASVRPGSTFRVRDEQRVGGYRNAQIEVDGVVLEVGGLVATDEEIVAACIAIESSVRQLESAARKRMSDRLIDENMNRALAGDR